MSLEQQAAAIYKMVVQQLSAIHGPKHVAAHGLAAFVQTKSEQQAKSLAACSEECDACCKAMIAATWRR